jgi:uncharacterized glyoxalase superfamily protein PhnB
MDPVAPRPTITPILWYQDPQAALAWLEKAFGFETRMVVTGDAGEVMHSETALGDGVIMVVGPPVAPATSPALWAGRYTMSIHVQLKDGIDEHYARARAAGAVITREIADQAYGDRVYVCTDLEGCHWSFGQTLQALSHDQMAAATGHAIAKSLEPKEA